MVEETIVLDELAHHNFVLQAAFDPTLEEIKSKLMAVMDGLDDEHDAVANSTGIDKEKKLHLEKHHVYGYSLRVTKAVSFCRFVRAQLTFLLHAGGDQDQG
jgi:DNA mismatch repair protein MSH2